MKFRNKILLTALALLAASNVHAQELAAETVQDNLNYVWTIIAACLVFFMQAGFAMVEIGFCSLTRSSIIDSPIRGKSHES